MADARHFCPDCGFIDLIIENEHILDLEGNNLGKAKCPNCAWEGPLSKTLGAVTSEVFWDADKVGDVLLRVFAQRAAGPIWQVLEFTGLLHRAEQTEYQTVPGYRDQVQESRNNVLRRITEAALTTAFEAATEEHAKMKALLEQHGRKEE